MSFKHLTNDFLEDDNSGILSKDEARKYFGADIDHELWQGLRPAVNRPGIERPRTITEQIAFEAECDAVKEGWA